jgi:hypothetical protein
LSSLAAALLARADPTSSVTVRAAQLATSVTAIEVKWRDWFGVERSWHRIECHDFVAAAPKQRHLVGMASEFAIAIRNAGYGQSPFKSRNHRGDGQRAALFAFQAAPLTPPF